MGKTTLDTPQPPSREILPLIHASPQVESWLAHYWEKLKLPASQLRFFALTMDRQEYARWTGRRLQSMALGCYCYLPLGKSAGPATDLMRVASAGHSASRTPSLQLALPGFDMASEEHATDAYPDAPTGDFRHLIFIEPGMLERGIEVTVAHELIHLSDRVHGRPRKHRCHGNDAIAMDEAAITGRDAETVRRELAEETRRREESLRRIRPYKYFYYCPRCQRNYPRVRRYARPVSCGHCFRQYNPEVLLRLRLSLDGPDVDPGFGGWRDGRDDSRDSLTA